MDGRQACVPAAGRRSRGSSRSDREVAAKGVRPDREWTMSRGPSQALLQTAGQAEGPVFQRRCEAGPAVAAETSVRKPATGPEKWCRNSWARPPLGFQPAGRQFRNPGRSSTSRSRSHAHAEVGGQLGDLRSTFDCTLIPTEEVETAKRCSMSWEPGPWAVAASVAGESRTNIPGRTWRSCIGPIQPSRLVRPTSRGGRRPPRQLGGRHGPSRGRNRRDLAGESWTATSRDLPNFGRRIPQGSRRPGSTSSRSSAQNFADACR